MIDVESSTFFNANVIGGIVGGIVGLIVLVLLIVVVCLVMASRRRREQPNTNNSPKMSASSSGQYAAVPRDNNSMTHDANYIFLAKKGNEYEMGDIKMI
jgi:hypothetical protein